MYLKNRIVYLALCFVFFSCSHSNQFPPKLTEKMASENVVLNASFLPANNLLFRDSVQKNDFKKELNDLLSSKKNYDDRNISFNLTDLENSWSIIQKQSGNFSFESVNQWIEITGFLLEITGNERYAQELEETVYSSSSLYTEAEFTIIEKIVSPWIFTKEVDHIHVNLFANATIKYEHTLKGSVEITQESNYPESGKIQLKFKMQNKRYIELFIRIPEWAEGATVTEWRVKYVATPGSYCQVVRKWSDGDIVEINLPMEQMPKR